MKSTNTNSTALKAQPTSSRYHADAINDTQMNNMSTPSLSIFSKLKAHGSQLITLLFIILCSLSTAQYAQAQDNDLDGIVDAIDVDDDNDGVLDAIQCPPLTSQSLANGDFEAYDPISTAPGYQGAGSNFALIPSGDATNVWETTATGVNAFVEVGTATTYGLAAQSGNNMAELNAFVPASTYQDVITTPGETIRWSLYHHGRDGVDVMAVDIGPVGGLVQQGGNLSTGNTAWVQYQGLYVVPVGQTTTRFSFRSVSSSSGSAAAGNLLDNIQFSPVNPDADLDGVDDCVDLDADNDGIPDNIEIQATASYVAPGVAVQGLADPFPGLLIAYSAAPQGTYPTNGVVPIDTDSDGMADYEDMDSDNDGIDDTTEAGIVLANNDADLDGLDDNVDATVGPADVNGIFDDTPFGEFPNVFNPGTTEVDFREVASPGCVSENLRLWLKADLGGAAATWTDQSGNGYNGTAPGGSETTVAANAVNFNPALDFDPGDYYALTTGTNLGLTGSAQITVFSVSNNEGAAATPPHVILGAESVIVGFDYFYSIVDGGFETNTLAILDRGNIVLLAGTNTVDDNFHLGYGSNSATTYYGAFDGSLAENNVITPPVFDGTKNYHIGRANAGTENYNGKMAEIIIYDAYLDPTGTDRQKIESYLAIKYGITLSSNYIASTGTTLWTLGGGYDNDITGIGREDAQALDQQKSRSINTGSVVTIDNGSSLANDASFMLWGNDAGVLTAASSLDAPSGTVCTRIAREWIVESTNYAETVSLEMDFDNGSAITFNNGMQLIIDEDGDGDFTTGTVRTATASSFDDIEKTVTFNALTLNDGEVFTLVTDLLVPGGVATNLALWLKADSDVTGTTNVTNWGNQVLNDVDDAVAIGGTGPELVANAINNNPALRFDGTLLEGFVISNEGVFKSTQNYTAQTYFAVTSPNAGGNPNPVVYELADQTNSNFLYMAGPGENGANGDYFISTPGVLSPLFSTTTPNFGQARIQTLGYDDDLSNGFTNRSRFTENGTELFVDNTLNAFTPFMGEFGTSSSENTFIGLGNTPTSVGYDGDIAELIIYDGPITNTQISQIESYLAIKYGTTLSHDYLSATGTMIYDVGVGYDNNITGIGREDCSGLDQQKSKSVNSDAIVTFANGAIGAPVAFTADQSFSFIGNNNGGSVWEDNDTPLDFQKLGRIWQLSEAGTVGAVQIEFDVDDADFDIPAFVKGTSYFIIYDTNNDGNFADETPLVMTNSAGSFWTVPANDFTATTLFTIATMADDWDDDGIADVTDFDDDNDGIPDLTETAGLDPLMDGDSDGVPLYLDDDDGAAGTGNANGIVEAAFDTDGDNIANHFDLDADNDGIYDVVEAGHGQAHVSGIIGGPIPVVGTDGIPDVVQGAGNENSATINYTVADSEAAPDGTGDFLELDADGDLCNDVLEAGLLDGDSNGLLGTGTFGAGLTVDVNGVVTSAAGYTTPANADGDANFDFQQPTAAPTVLTDPTDEILAIGSSANFTVTGSAASITYQWQESTNGGATFADITDGGQYSGATTNSLLITGVLAVQNGILYQVIIGDNVVVCFTATSNSALLTVDSDLDLDLVPNITDLDDDNDGITDLLESGGIDPLTDGDSDGVPIYLDDDDGDNLVGNVNGIVEATFDTDGDNVANHFDLDSDNDGIYDLRESGFMGTGAPVVADADNNGIIDGGATTFGNNGLYNSIESDDTFSATLTIAPDESDSNGSLDAYDLDSDSDLCNDVTEAGFTDSGNGTVGSVVDANGVVIAGTYATPNDNDSNGIFDFQEQIPFTSSQPVNLSLSIGSTAVFTVVTSGPLPTNFQWEESTDGGITFTPLANGGIYSGVLTTSITINPVDITLDRNIYRVGISVSNYVCGQRYTVGAELFVDSDTDNDGILDQVDIDDDNDGILDIDEGFGVDCNSFTINAGTTPIDNWIIQTSEADKFGASGFNAGLYTDNTSLGQVYNEDRFENWDASGNGSGDTDIQSYSTGYDGTFYYFEFKLREDWNYDGQGVSHSYNLEIDTDGLGAGDAKGEYYVRFFPATTDVGSTWIDVGDPFGIERIELFQDTNNDIGGANALGSDAIATTGGDGYETDILRVSTKFYARIINGKVEIAIHKDRLDNSDNVRSRCIVTQDSSIPASKLLVHDQFLEADLTGFRFDTFRGVDPSEWNTAGQSSGVCAVVDSDGDGVADHVDLDSDNDGIYDAIEAGHGQALDVNGRIAAALAGSGANGYFDGLETAEDGVSTYTVTDSDGDLILDLVERDADNDGCDDVLEAGFTDADMDGELGSAAVVVDANGVVTSGTGYTTPADADVNAVADYQEAGTAPSLTTSPTDQLTIIGANAIFTAAASASTVVTFQWQESTDGGTVFNDISDGVDFAGTNTNTLTVLAVDATQSGNLYQVVVGDIAFVCGDMTSTSALLTTDTDTDLDGIADITDIDDDNDGILDLMDALQIGPGCVIPSGILSGGVLDAGIDGQIGAVYRFSGAILGLDILMVITDKTANATLIAFDENAGEGFANNLQPRIENTNPTPGTFEYIEFEMRTVLPGTSTLFTLPRIDARVYDLDGANRAEIIQYAGPNAFIIDKNADINVNQLGGFFELSSTGNSYTIANKDTEAIAHANFENTAVFTVRIGGETSDVGGTLHSLEFDVCNASDILEPQLSYFSGLDNDGDGIANHLDSDSDGDGIGDLRESGADLAVAVDADNDGVIDGLPAAFGSNGYFDGIETGTVGAADYIVVNTDASDLVQDFLDLDSDNDHIPDNVEAQLTVGFVVPAGTADARGIDTAYGGLSLIPENTDGLGDGADYIDTDSDEDGESDTIEGDDLDFDGTADTTPIGDADFDGLDDAFDATVGYANPNGNITMPSTQLPDEDGDVLLADGDVDYRDAVILEIVFNNAAYADLEASGGNLPTISVSGGILANPITVEVAQTATTGTTGTDFTFTSAQTITIPAGDYSVTPYTEAIALIITDDQEIETDETIDFVLQNPGAGSILGTQITARYTITDDDQLTAVFTLANSADLEATGANLPVVSVSGGIITSTLTIDVVQVSTSGTSGTDFTFITQTINIPAGDYTVTPFTQTIALTIIDDNVIEPDETIGFELQNPSTDVVVGAQMSTIYTITDDDMVTVQFDAATYSDDEAVGGNQPVVTVSGALLLAPLTIEVAQTATTGTAGTDFTFTSPETITIPAGDYTAVPYSQAIALVIVDDAAIEPNETIDFVLQNASAGVSIGAQSTSQYTIADDDGVSVEFTSATYADLEASGGNLPVITVSGGVLLSPLTVEVAQTATTGTSGTDFTFTSPETITIPAGDYTVTPFTQAIALIIVDDALLEADETISFTLQNPGAGVNVGGQASTIYTIQDDESASVSIVSTSNGAEPGTPLTFDVTLSSVNNTGADILITLDYSGGTATGGAAAGSGNDYNNAITIVVIPNGQSTATHTVPVFDDVAIESDETVEITILSASSGVTVPTDGTEVATGSIIEDDTASISIAQTTDGAEPSTDATFTVSLTTANTTGGPITVSYSFTGGTAGGGAAAGAGVDYNNSTTTVIIPNGATSAVITVPTLDDTDFEGTETVEVTIVNAGALVTVPTDGTEVATANITDDDVAVLSVASTVNGVEDATSPTSITYTVTMSEVNNTGAPITVTYGFTVSGTATGGAVAGGGSDFNNTGTTVTIPVGQSTAVITVPVFDDLDFEGSETVEVELTATTGGVSIATDGTEKATGSIIDDESSIVTIALAMDGAEPATDVTFTVTLSKPNTTGSDITVTYGFTGGTATGGTDYTNTGTTVIIPNGSSTATITVPVLDDADLEGSETLDVTITAITGGVDIPTDGTEMATGTITDDESASVSMASTTDGDEELTVPVTFTVTMTETNNTGADITITYAYTGGTATGVNDYDNVLNTVVIPVGANSAVISIPVVDDAIFENSEDVILSIISATAGVIVPTDGTESASGNIADNDMAVVSIASNTAGSEPSTDPSFTVSLSEVNNTGAPITVTYSFTGGSATGGMDYDNTTLTVVIPDGQSSAVITVPVIDDNVFEGNEGMELTLVSTDNPDVTVATDGTEVSTATIFDDEVPILSVTANTDGTEGGADATFTVDMGVVNDTGAPITVTYTYSGGSATNGTDYDGTTITVVIPVGASSAVIAVPITADGVFEATETIEITLVSATGGVNVAVDGTQTRSTNILDSSVVSTSISAHTDGAEPGTAITYTVSLNTTNNTGSDIVVTYAFTGGTAIGGTDYDNAGPFTVAIPDGSISATLTVPVIDDVLLEGTESVEVTLITATGGAVIAVDGTEIEQASIADDESVSANITAHTDGAEPATDVTFTISLQSTNNTGADVTITYAFSGGTATAGTDYDNSTLMAVIPDGQSFVVVTVPVIDDADFEGPETVEMTLTGVTSSGAVVIANDGSETDVATIADEDVPSVSITGNTDGAEPMSNATFTVSLNNVNNTGGSITVTYSYSGGTATGGTDYDNTTVTVDIPDGQSSVTITIPVIDDALFEGSETVIVTLVSATGGAIVATDGTETRLTTIQDGEAVNASVTASTDGKEGVSDVTFTIGLNIPNNTGADVTVNFTYTGGTATGLTDYDNTQLSVIIPDGQSQVTVTLPVVDDALFEGPESVEITLASATGGVTIATDGTETGTATIIDDDGTSVSLTSSTNGVEGGANLTFTVELSNVNNTGSPITITYSLGGGTATPGVDYDNTVVTIVIPVGQSSGTIIIPVTDDMEYEGLETIEATITGATGGVTVATDGTEMATSTIVDNDPAIASIVMVSDGAEPGTATTFEVDLGVVNETGADIVVTYMFSGGTATGGTDYDNSTLSVVIPNGSSSGTIMVPTMDDTDFEGAETIEVTLVSATGGVAVAADGTQVGTGTITDDEIVTASITAITDGMEDATSPTDITFTISLDNSNSTGADIVVTYSFAGTATGGADYNNSIVTAVIMAGQSSVVVTVPVIDDTDIEVTETVIVTLTGATGGVAIATGGSETSTADILDNDADPTLTLIETQDSEIVADGLTTTIIKVTVVDVNGDPVTGGGANVMLFTDLGSISGVTDNGDGTYTAILTSNTDGGTATITGTLNGFDITDNAIVDFTTDLVFNQGISPNDDGDNETWYIQSIERYPNNTVQIYNRWGNEVWSTTGYDNQGNNWGGQVEAKFVLGQTDLPAGTYFYLVDLKDGSDPFTGFIVLFR